MRRRLFGSRRALRVRPYYNKSNQCGMKAHFEAIADTSPVPVIVYNVPGRVGVNLQAVTCVTLKIGRAHAEPITRESRMPSSA